jgi:hypothetical protein
MNENIINLPCEIINLIAGDLPLDDLIKFSRTCPYIYDALQHMINLRTNLKKRVGDEIKKINYSINNRESIFTHGNEYSLRILGSKFIAYFSREYYDHWMPIRGHGLTQNYDSSLCVLSNNLKMTTEWIPIIEEFGSAMPDFKFNLGPEGDDIRGPFGDDCIDGSEEHRYVCVRGVKHKKSKVDTIEEFIRAINVDIYLLDCMLDVCVIHVGSPMYYLGNKWEHNSGYDK